MEMCSVGGGSEVCVWRCVVLGEVVRCVCGDV